MWLGLWPRPPLSVQTHIDRALVSAKLALTPRPRLLCQCPAPESSTESSGSHQELDQNPAPTPRAQYQDLHPTLIPTTTTNA